MYYYFVLAWLFSFFCIFLIPLVKFSIPTQSSAADKRQVKDMCGCLFWGGFIGSCSVITLFKFSSLKDKDMWLRDCWERTEDKPDVLWVVTTRGKQRMLWENIFTFLHSYNITCLSDAVSIGTEMPESPPWCLSSQVVLGARVRREFWAGFVYSRQV